MTERFKQVAKTWVPVVFLFSLLFVTSISMMVTRPVFHQGESYYSPSAFSALGHETLGKMWIEYPTYYSGFILMMVVSGGGAIYAVYMMDRKLKEDETQGNNTRV